MNIKNSISSPLFIVGMPRSGTKLLRSLLNNHPKISILTIETEFLPYWVKNWHKFGRDLHNYKNFLKFYKKMIKLPYFLYMAERGELIKPKEWFKRCKSFDVAGVFEALAKHDCKVTDDMIWGDKSPGYIRHIPLLKKLFPSAKIIHIIRDVRDYCLSINKTWGKNMLRAAQRWVDYITKARSDGKKIGNDYFEIKYEDLLDNPEYKIKEICDFLNIEYHSAMLRLDRPTENIGDAKGIIGILKNNKEKYKKLMDPILRKKIESISWHVLLSLDYPVKEYGKIERIGKIKMGWYKLLDGYNLIKTKSSLSGDNIIKRLLFHIYHQKISRF